MHGSSKRSRRMGFLGWFLIGGGVPALSGCSQGESASDRLAVREPSGGVTQELERKDPLTSSVGATGAIEIAPDFIQGAFHAGDTIVRAKGHPECVVYVEAAEAPHSPAGTLTISSELVGEPGGPATPFMLNPDPSIDNLYLEFPDPPLYDAPDGTWVEVQLSGNSVFPAIRRTRVRSPLFASINVNAPTLPASGVLAIQSTKSLEFEWDVPRHAHEQGCQNVSARLFVLSPTRWAQLLCSWPLRDGHGSLPAVLLREARALLETSDTVDAVVDVYGGEFREVATASSSYVIFPTTVDTTTFPRSTPATFD